MPETSISIRRAQKGGQVLAGELRGGAQAVRSDLLRDAIETLRALAGAEEEDVMRRRLEVEAATSSIAAFG